MMKFQNRVPLSFSSDLSPYLDRLISDLARDLGGITNLEARDENQVFLECIFPLSELSTIFQQRIQSLSINLGTNNHE